MSDEVKVMPLTMEGLGPWSHSKVKSLQNCPFQFYLKYIHKLKGPVFKSPEALLGSAAHKILELFVVGKPLTQAYNEARKEFHESLGDDLWQQVINLETSIVEFKRRVDDFDKQNPIKRIFTEVRVGITKDFTPSSFFGDDVFFRGILDLVLHLQNGDAIFIDHKKGGSALYGIKKHSSQLNSQKVLFHDGIEPINGGTSGIHFIEAGQIKLDDHHTREEIETRLRREILFNIDNAIHRVLELGYFKHIAGNACKYCEFSAPCKNGTLRQLELNTKTLCLEQLKNESKSKE